MPEQELRETGFVIAWIGVLLGLICFIILSLKAKEQVSIHFVNETNQQSIPKIPEKEDMETVRKDVVILLLAAFGCTICTTIYCAYYAILGILPSRFNISNTAKFCKYIGIPLAGTSWQFSRYCFYIFMLWRIQATFRNPVSLRMSRYTIYISLIFIHLWLVLALVITIFLTPATAIPSGHCVIYIEQITDRFNTSDMRTVLVGFDAVLTVGLMMLFIRKLYQLTAQNENVNKFKQKTAILGLIATVTSMVIFITNMRIDFDKWRYFVPLDSIINLFCVVFTYKISFIYKRLCKSHKVKDENGKYNEANNQESTYSKQPNDSIVWKMLEDAQEYDKHDHIQQDMNLEANVAELQETKD